MLVLAMSDSSPCYCMACKLYKINWRVDKDFIFGNVRFHIDVVRQQKEALAMLERDHAPKFMIDMTKDCLKKREFMLSVLHRDRERILNQYYR